MVLVAVSTARTKAKEARIKADIQQLRVLAESTASDNNGVYTTLSGTNYTTLSNDISSQGGAVTQNIGASGVSYCASSTLPSGNNYCMDTAGKVGTAACSSGVCP